MAGLHQHTLRGKGQTRGPHALLPDLSPSVAFYRSCGVAVVRACQNRITRCAVVGDSRSKFENALSRAVLVDLTCGRERMTARAVGHPQPAALHRIRIGSGRLPPMRRSTTSIGTEHKSSIAATTSS